MSDTDHQITDILLPGANVAVFSEDQETLDSANVMTQDWRFARVNLNIHKGDVETAIKHFQSNPSADLIIIQTNEIDDSFTDRLGELSAYCNEGTSAIIIGPVNDVYLYRRLIAMGISDYLVRPVKPEIFTHLIAKTLVKNLGVSGSRLIAFIGAKGGVGTTSIAQAYAWGIANVLEQKTTLLDAAGGWSSLSVGISFDPATTLAQFARAVENKNEDIMKRILFKADDRLTVVAGGADAMLDGTIPVEQYEKILDHLMIKSPVVLVDLSGADNTLKRMVMTRANKIILVTTPTVTALRFARSLIKEISEVRGGQNDDVALIVNQQGLSKSHEVTSKDIQEALDFKISATVPFSPALFLGNESETQKIVSDKEGSNLLKTVLLPVLKSILSRSSEEDKIDGSKKSGVLSSFLSKRK